MSAFVPSARSLLVALAILLGGVGSYFLARDTSMFAVRTISVEGAPPHVSLQVRRVLQEELGTSLLRVDLDRARTAVGALPTIASASFDRAFPHTLRVTVVPERGVAVIRSGATSWLVSARGRAMAELERGRRLDLPRVWAGVVPLTPGDQIPPALRAAIAAASPLARNGFGGHVASVRSAADELTLVLRSGLEIRLGDAREIALKLAVARQVLPHVASGTRYVDVSVPEWPVAGSLFAAKTAAKPPVTEGTTKAADSLKDGAAVSNKSLKSQPYGETSPSSHP